MASSARKEAGKLISRQVANSARMLLRHASDSSALILWVPPTGSLKGRSCKTLIAIRFWECADRHHAAGNPDHFGNPDAKKTP